MMKIRTFRGRTMADTLKQVKRHFGPGAVILNTRSVAEKGLFGVGKKPLVEISAARALADLPESLRGGTLTDRRRPLDQAEGAATVTPQPSRFSQVPTPETLLSEVGALKSLVHDLVRQTRRAGTAHAPDELHGVYKNLIENAVADEIAQQLVAEARRKLAPGQRIDRDVIRTNLTAAVETMLPTAGPIRLSSAAAGPTIIALIGPTGVGKTTTIAKLAAHFCLRARKKVGLVTIDTYRIAAVEQLRTYAEIINVPLEVVMSQHELPPALDRLADRDVIFLDTAGRSPRDREKNAELQRFFQTVRPHEVHLVLAGTSAPATLFDAVDRFRHLGIDRVIFTKLDETVGFGVMLACLQKAGARLSYVTTGQDVPDDIRVGEAGALARLILGQPGQRQCRDGPASPLPAPAAGAEAPTAPGFFGFA